MQKVRILILGTGGMASSHAKAYAHIEGAEIVAGVDIDADAVNAFCDKYGIVERFTSLEDALAWGDFDAVSNVTPDRLHHRTTMRLLAAGKHVFCEKPLATSFVHAQEMAQSAHAAGVVNMVKLSYRDVPALQKAAELVRDGLIGTPKHFEASYLQSWLTQDTWGDWRTDPTWLWRLSTEHGSNGVLGDVGVHILDFVCFAAGSIASSVSCRAKTFDKIKSDRIGEYVLDANDSCIMSLALANGAIGTVTATRFASGHHNDLYLRLYGDLGGLEVRFEDGTGSLRASLGADMKAAKWREVEAPDVKSIYAKFVEAILNHHMAAPDFETGAQLQKVLDAASKSSCEASVAQSV